MADQRPEDAPALDQLLASLGPADQMRAFYEARLGRLQEYDERHSAQLIPTLDAYFAVRLRSMGSAKSGAAARRGIVAGSRDSVDLAVPAGAARALAARPSRTSARERAPG
jgi:hypothetical protein